MSDHATQATEAKLSRGTVSRYAMGSLGTGGFATLPGLVLVYFLTDTLGVAAIVAGLIVTGAKVWDVLIDPVIGGLSDRAFERKGSRRGPMPNEVWPCVSTARPILSACHRAPRCA